ncbi:MAG: nitroreductase family deazaflavin-dependent oxidoreductase [Gammaproteobacteria bacterium]
MAEQKKKVWRTPPWVPGHIEQFTSDPDGAGQWDARQAGVDATVPALLLITRGRRSGEPRPAPVIYQKVDAGYCVIASKGGWPDHPAWFLNLQADPVCEIQVGRERLRARARVAEGAERAALWATMRAAYSAFDDYQARTQREIPVVVLEPLR